MFGMPSFWGLPAGPPNFKCSGYDSTQGLGDVKKDNDGAVMLKCLVTVAPMWESTIWIDVTFLEPLTQEAERMKRLAIDPWDEITKPGYDSEV